MNAGTYQHDIAAGAEGRTSGPIGKYGADENRIVSVAVAELLPADSPRLAGENIEHITMLAESEAELPPIVVHRPTMRVIDGMHRLRAARLRGAQQIDARFVDDTDGKDLFVLAVKANIAHGLPLTLADRQAAAARIVISHPQWSDRSIAKVTGLAAKTVRTVREQTMGDAPSPHSRVGQDGKVRPLSTAVGRKAAGEILSANPHASLRQVARDAGISLGTAFDVRKRLLSGEDPVASRRCGPPPDDELTDPTEEMAVPSVKAQEHDAPSVRRRDARQVEQPVVQDPSVIMHMLMRDPSLRFTDSGRLLLRWLNSRGISLSDCEEMVESVPPHCTRTVADYARRIADSWAQFAEQLEQREKAMA
ncbi:ParB N-terminal domain-containing protein [Kitasatospora sp. LaBMicrA B282]|uniref:ParB N-terminal domain-containing protein n=1 Tax=Kitasatospora sp. LaBMicrA B282 TaxID=3420949 RepID=UPI003D10B5B1